MSDLAIAITTGSFTLAAGVLGVLGTSFSQHRARKREEEAAHQRVVSEVIAASGDLLGAIRLFRNVWSLGWRTPVAAGIEARTAQLALTGKPTLWIMLGAALKDAAAAMTVGGVIERGLDRSGAKYMELVMPARQRLTAAIATLRISPDTRLAAAADNLAKAGDELASRASSLQARVFRRAEAIFEQRLAEFQVASSRQKKR